ncbi:hypothetical protein IMSAGC020_00228 [Lachnospiraceae bacterium]|nr:hypothetical protein IMSAGC020_00228 [Lachnospiraceae bacterium]
MLTCYKLLKPADGNISVVPGNFGENLTIYVKGMHNGETFTPIISAAMDGGAWDGPCENEEHQVDSDGETVMEKKTVTPDPVTVTAAPKYNIRLQSESSYRDIFEFQGSPEWMAQYGDKAANTDLENPIPGRLMKLGIVLQLYNDNAAKGLKGIELPKGPISFDLELLSVYPPCTIWIFFRITAHALTSFAPLYHFSLKYSTGIFPAIVRKPLPAKSLFISLRIL